MQQELTTEQLPGTTQPMLDRVYGSDTSRAQIELAQSPSSHIPELIAILERENKKKPRRFAVGVAVTYAIIIAISIPLNMSSIVGSVWMLAVAAGAGFAPTALQKRAARWLSEVNDVRAVGPLAESLDKQDSGTKKLAINALIRLLPSLQHSDYGLITDNQRKLLYSGLASGGEKYTRVLVRALEQIGDGKAVPYVQKLADGKGVAKKHPDIAEDAKHCLPVLKERESAEHLRDTLLRAAGVSESGEELLLRPAHDSGPSDPALLLRPTMDT